MDDSAVQPDIPLPRLRPRPRDGHKGDFGRVLLIGGSRGMAGAIALAGMAALRSGAGLVTAAVPDQCLDTVATFEASLMTVPLPSDGEGCISAQACQRIEELARSATVIGCGPGLGRSSELDEFVGSLQEKIELPIVFDADALNALAERDDWMISAAGPRVLTPHPGEFRRLARQPGLSVEKARLQAVSFARTNQVVLVLKGHQTIVTDGTETARNATGNPGMATGGSGDVLTGVISALIGQGLTPLHAARLGAHIHGLAGDMAAERCGEISLVASDLISFLPPAFEAYIASSP